MSALGTRHTLRALSELTAADWKRINAALAKDEADDHESDVEGRRISETRQRVFEVLRTMGVKP